VEDIADETTHMVVLEILELERRQNISQEAEDSHVDKLDIARGPLQRRVIEAHDAGGDADVAHLFRLILELDH